MVDSRRTIHDDVAGRLNASAVVARQTLSDGDSRWIIVLSCLFQEGTTKYHVAAMLLVASVSTAEADVMVKMRSARSWLIFLSVDIF